MEDIIEAIVKYYEVSKEDLVNKCKKEEFVTPRQMAMYIMRTKNFTSFQKIGRRFNRNHSTVVYSVNKIKEDIDFFKSMKAQYDAIIKIIEGKFIPVDKYYGGKYPEFCNPCIYVRP